MLKKGLIAGGGALLLLGLIFGRDLCNFVGTATGLVRETVRDSVPIDFELKRARQMIASLSPEISKHKREIAREELALTKLEERLEQDEQKLAKKWSDIQRLRDDLARGETNYVYASGTYTAKQVETDLGNKFDRYTTSDATVEQNRKVLAIRKKALSAAQDKLTALIAAKQKLEVEVENLEARLKMVEVAKATSELNIDDSQLSRTRELLADIEARIEVDAQLVNADDFVFGEIQLEEPDGNVSILQRIAEYEDKKDQSETYVDVKPQE
jgi:chromosome segregation ATPase